MGGILRRIKKAWNIIINIGKCILKRSPSASELATFEFQTEVNPLSEILYTPLCVVMPISSATCFNYDRHLHDHPSTSTNGNLFSLTSRAGEFGNSGLKFHGFLHAHGCRPNHTCGLFDPDQDSQWLRIQSECDSEFRSLWIRIRIR